MAETTEKEMKVVFERPHSLLPVVTNFCPGCPHGIVERLVCEVMDELDIEGETIGVAPVGCSVISYDFFGCDMIEAAHGRAPAVATAVKRVHPDKVVFAYQGDGDLASIGMAETVHAATRGENITIIFINNAIYGMTGGQMAPTSLPNQVTQTSPYGRDVSTAGNPIRVSELLNALDGPAYIERVCVDTPKNVRKAKKAIKKAFQNQIDGVGYSFIEVVSTCPTNWGMTPQDAFEWMRVNMLPYYPLGVVRDVTADGFANAAEAASARNAACPIAHPEAVSEGGTCVVAGFGGQGSLFAGKVIATAGLIEDREVSWMPSYGPEMRGGTANCSVTLSDKPIGSPLITRPSALIALNQPSFDKFIDNVEEGGIVVVDTAMVPSLTEPEGVTVIGIPATKMCEEAGLKGLGNIVLIGKLWAETGFCSEEALDGAIAKVAGKKPEKLEQNRQAIKLGINA